MSDRAKEYEMAKQSWDTIFKFFDGDIVKAIAWFTTPNPNFGGISPIALIKAGRLHKVRAFIWAATNGEAP